MLRCNQMRNKWEQLRFVVRSHLIFGITIALLNLLWTCIVQMQCVREFVHKRTFQSLDRSDYQGLHCKFNFQVRNNPFEEQSKSFFSNLAERIHVFEQIQKSLQNVMGGVYCLGIYCSRQNFVCVHTWKENDGNCHDCFQGKACCYVLNIPFSDQKPTILLIGGDGTYCFVRKMSRSKKNEKPFSLLKNFRRPSKSTTPEPVPKKTKMVPFLT